MKPKTIMKLIKKIKELNIPKDDRMTLIYEEMLNNRKDSEK